MPPLDHRIADALGWPIEAVHGFDAATLRDLLLPDALPLASELTLRIRDAAVSRAARSSPRGTRAR